MIICIRDELTFFHKYGEPNPPKVDRIAHEKFMDIVANIKWFEFDIEYSFDYEGGRVTINPCTTTKSLNDADVAYFLNTVFKVLSSQNDIVTDIDTVNDELRLNVMINTRPLVQSH